jgi:hypothetical protein
MITCCEIALCLALTNIVSLTIFAGYTLKVSRRTIKLEKKNGHEQHQIDELKTRLDKKDQKYKKLQGEIRLIKTLMTLSEEARQKEAEKQSEED